MKLAGLTVAALLTVPGAARAGDATVLLTLEGRPVDRHRGVAILHRGVVYADAIDLTKSFDGFITLRRDGSATITIGINTGTFVPGSRRAIVNAARVDLPVAPLVRGGDLFVPLDAFIARIAAASVHTDVARRHADIRVAAESP